MGKLTTRRSALGVLGLAPAAAVVSPDVTALSPPGYHYKFGLDRGLTVRALRQLADEVELGGVLVTKLGLHTCADAESFVESELRLSFVVKENKPA